MRRTLARLALVGLGAAGAYGGLWAQQRLRHAWPAAVDPYATNYRGHRVSLAGGPALSLAASVSAAAGAPRLAAPALVAGLGCAVVGRYDDVVKTRPGHADKGLRGHLRALRAGRVTSGAVKLAGITASGLVAGALLPTPRRGTRRAIDAVLAGGVIAGTANLLNLLDLRPGRALKAGLLLGAPLAATTAAAAGPVGAAAALLAADLDEQIMLGDSGANSLGALLGLALAARTGTAGRAATLAALAALALASERVSFTSVINATPTLRRIDRLGRRA